MSTLISEYAVFGGGNGGHIFINGYAVLILLQMQI